MARDHCAYLHQCLEDVDFLAVPLGPGLFGGRFLVDMVSGVDVDWAGCLVPAEQADCVLVVLGLLHMWVKCVIPEELGGDYVPEVSGP